jgi:hypothetical protein
LISKVPFKVVATPEGSLVGKWRKGVPSFPVLERKGAEPTYRRREGGGAGEGGGE